MRTFAGLVLAAALVVVLPGAAQAEHNRFNDAGGDVWAHRGSTSTQEVSHTDGDIRIVAIQHRKRTVRLFMQVQTIDADGGSSFKPQKFRFSLVNGRGLVKVFELTSNNKLRIRKAVGGGYVQSSCRWTTHSVNKANGHVRLSLPRSCMGRPKALRLEAMSVDFDRAGTTYVDDAYSIYDPTGGPTSPGSSPWVKRG